MLKAMAQIDAQLTTGLPGLDRMLKGLIPGDNIVWLVDDVSEYESFLRPYYSAALRQGRRVIYLRFAGHERLVPDLPGLDVHTLDPHAGFEKFTGQVHGIIENAGQGAFYIFDCLSELAVYWYSDQMLANFFLLTCPYLLDIEAIAYFALRRGFHATYASDQIRETAQILLNVYSHADELYLQPLKVQQRYSPTMHMLHAVHNDEFYPVTDSATIAEVVNAVGWLDLNPSERRQGLWSRTFSGAENALEALRQGRGDEHQARDLFRQMLRMIVSRDKRVLELLDKYMILEDVVRIGQRMIGTGLIGGKSVGMLLARAILNGASERWPDLLEPHDSFYVGSDVFYTFLVRNGAWWTRQRQRDPAHFLDDAERARRSILRGTFPDFIERQFNHMLDYFGQSPFIVRSSSLLEDNFGNAFAGKYESVFCVNQGPRHKRLEDLLSAVRTIYASSMSEKALRYRAQRGLLEMDEQMALLVQRVSGSLHGRFFYPHVAGVGLSFNPYVWNREIDPNSGMLRLVFGLGTRAVDRSDDDYTRVVALNAPQRRPEASFNEVRQYSQRRVDVLDFDANQLVPTPFAQVMSDGTDVAWDLFAQPDGTIADAPAAAGLVGSRAWVLTFSGLFARTDFISEMRQLLAILQEAYAYPVEVEFTANFAGGDYRVNLLQCRPLQVKGGGSMAETPPDVPSECVLLRAQGAVIGQSQRAAIERLIYVVPSVYGQLPIPDRYSVARTIGRLAHLEPRPRTIMLVGPGRWGTRTPSLGVPVAYADINTVSILCEIVAMRDDLIPDVSLGTHFFNELVEMDVLYLAVFPSYEGNLLNRDLLENTPSRLATLLPSAARWADCIRVLDARDFGSSSRIQVHANAVQQSVVVYLDH
jgi:pyruvate,water dikinase